MNWTSFFIGFITGYLGLLIVWAIFVADLPSQLKWPGDKK